MSDSNFRSSGFRHDAPSPLGRITQAKVLNNSSGLARGKMRVYGSYALVYVLDGNGSYRDVNRVERNVSAGDVIQVFPEIGHNYRAPDGETWNEIHIVFEGAVFDLWRASGLLDASRPVVSLMQRDVWTARFAQFAASPRAVTPGARAAEIARLLELLADIAEQAAPLIQTPDDSWLRRACDALEANLERDIDLSEVASHAGMGYEAFRKSFRAQTGTSPARYRAARVVDAACAMLQDGASNKQVAQRLGFADEFHFSKRFKQITGMAPRDFRRRLPQAASS